MKHLLQRHKENWFEMRNLDRQWGISSNVMFYLNVGKVELTYQYNSKSMITFALEYM